MLNLLQYRSWAISEEFFNSVSPAIYQWLATGHGMDRFVQKKTMLEHVSTLEGLLMREEVEAHGTGHADNIAGPISIGYDQAIGLPVASINNKNVAIIPISGVLTKYGELCSYGMQDYQAMIGRANSAPHIDAILMKMDSPGGTTDGTQELATTVRDSAKPIGVFVDGLLASAAYWIASQAQSAIIVNKFNSNTIGSIGTYGLYQNISEKLSKEGIQMKIIRAKQSTQKIAVNPLEQLTPALEGELVDNATSVNQVFIDYVKAARPNVDAGVFTAGVYNSAKAKEAGLIDGIGTMQTALNKLLELVKAQKVQAVSPQSQHANILNQNNNQTMDLLAFLGLSKEQKAKLSAEDQQKLDSLEATLTDLETKLSGLESEKTALAAKVSTLEAAAAKDATALTAKDATIADLTAKLDAKPLGAATTVVAAGDPEKKKTTETFATSVDAEAQQMREVLNPTLEVQK